MTSTQLLVVLLLCIMVQVSIQEKEKDDESFTEKKRALLKFIEGLESSLEHQEQERREIETKRKREEKIKRVKAELDKLKQEDEAKKAVDSVINDLDGGKRACGNRLSAGKCQLLRWFGKGCTGKKMIVNCRASCGLC